MKSLLLYAFLVLGLVACNSKPKVVSAEGAEMQMMQDNPHAAMTSGHTGMAHTVVCQDFMHTDKYTYMDVEENGQRYWIAVPRQDVEKGASYQYTGGLEKHNFKSVEFDRVFDKIYLVSGIIPAGGSAGSAVDRALAHANQSPPSAPAANMPPSEGTVKIAEIFENRAKYEGKVVTVSGQCVKLNKMIMGRNWLHIDDGSMDGDLTVTSQDEVPVGANATFTGTIALNRDFGAGYRYEVIMEEAKLVQ